MARDEILAELRLLEIQEKKLKDQLQLFTQFPEGFRENRSQLNERINENLDKLKIVWELQAFWLNQLSGK